MDIHNQNLLQQQVNQVIAQDTGSFFVIDYENSQIQSVLNFYHLHEVQGTCKPIYSTLDKDVFELCRVSKTT